MADLTPHGDNTIAIFFIQITQSVTGASGVTCRSGDYCRNGSVVICEFARLFAVGAEGDIDPPGERLALISGWFCRLDPVVTGRQLYRARPIQSRAKLACRGEVR